MALLVAGGLIAAACTSAPEETTQPLPETLPTLTPTTEEPVETTVPDEEYLWSVGDCVDLGADPELPYAPYGLELLTECAAPHTHEVFFTATLDGGPEAPYPAGLNERLFDRCFVEFAEFMGYPAADSTLDLVLYLPDEQEWADGERYHACVVYEAGTTVVYRPLVGSTADDPGSHRWLVSAGACYDLVDLPLLPVSDPVPCAERHGLEMIGEAPLAPNGAGYPGRDEAPGAAAAACDALLSEYSALPVDDLPVATFALPALLTKGDWDAGSRTVRCFAIAGTPERGLFLVTGSLGDGTFEIVDGDEDEGQTV